MNELVRWLDWCAEWVDYLRAELREMRDGFFWRLCVLLVTLVYTFEGLKYSTGTWDTVWHIWIAGYIVVPLFGRRSRYEFTLWLNGVGESRHED